MLTRRFAVPFVPEWLTVCLIVAGASLLTAGLRAFVFTDSLGMPLDFKCQTCGTRQWHETQAGRICVNCGSKIDQ